MSIINLGLQGIALKRRIIEDIQNASSFNQTLSEELKIAIKTILKEINGLFEDFDSLYEQNTTEKDIPSKKNHYECKELAPSGILIATRIFVRMNLTYNLLIEQVYYSCKIELSQICYYCNEEDNLVEPS
ncbi:hypothetical protein RhiirA4_458650 [Rhizophagus irregularis]|uniref:Uncharacterized protein n=1 Tax=Rhizophagus irregularis TaxID=588596 RepID=A0A2I1GCM8_9GLOM|nr:hypothetical protein RhiirA4_458650 [Rhizophagus irregularis]